MLNLEEAFQQLYQSGKQPAEIRDWDLLESVGKFNYISRSLEIEVVFAAALRDVYAGFCRKQGE
jgi:hypothetical protein